MNLQQLQYVIQVEKHRSFNKAAKVLFITQPTLSRAIKSIEAELGITLFTRSTQGVELTLAGEKFINFARSVTAQFEEISSAQFKGERLSPAFRLSTISSTFVSEAFVKMCELSKDEPFFRYTLNITRAVNVVDEVYNNQCDIGVIFIGSTHKDLWTNVLVSKGLVYTQLGTTRLNILISNLDTLAKKESVTLDDLANHTYVYLHPHDKDNESIYYLDYFNLIPNETQKKAILTYDREVAYQLVSRTKAFSFAYNQQKDYAHRYQLTCVPLATPNVQVELGYVIKVNSRLNDMCKKFLELLRIELDNAGIYRPAKK